MNSDDLVCSKCGETIFKAAQRGAYLKRTNPTGEDFILECAPSCEGQHGDQNDALINAVKEVN